MEFLLTTLEEISQENSVGELLILVEGKKDLAVLRKIGFKGPIKTIKGKKIPDLIEEIQLTYKKVLILSDWDEEGERIYKKIRYFLESYGIKVEDRYRKIIKNATRKEIKDVEGLLSYLSSMKNY